MKKTVVISGGSKGIGEAIALHFAKEDFNLAICARTEDDLEKIKKKLLTISPNIDVFIKSFAEDVLKRFKIIDVLVNNAGTYVGGNIYNEEEGVLEHLIETNLYSAYHLTRGFLPSMIDAKNGHIFNMCSVASLIAYPNGGSYSISKFALLGFSKCLREELKDKNIKVTSIMPGATWSDSWAGVDLPKERLMPASDIAKMIWGAYDLSKVGVVEDLVIRPILGDL